MQMQSAPLPAPPVAAPAAAPALDASCPMQLLPEELLAQVLLRVDRQQRMTDCAAVCSAWRSAATATITSLNHRRLTQARLDGLLVDLATRGERLQQLRLEGATAGGRLELRMRSLQLPPGNQLRVLRLKCLSKLRFGPCKGSPGIDAAALTALTSLKLSHCLVCSKPAPLKGLSTLTSLQELKLSPSPKSAGLGTPFPAGVLSKLQQLTRLVLRQVEVPAAALCGLSGLSGLQELTLKPPASACTLLTRAAVNSIAELQQLIALDLSMVSAPVTASSTPSFSKLTALRSSGCRTALGCTLRCWQACQSSWTWTLTAAGCWETALAWQLCWPCQRCSSSRS